MSLNFVPSAVTDQPGSIGYQHPEYAKRWWFWEFYRLAYVGGREYHKPARLTVEFQYPVTPGPRNSDGQLVSTSTISSNPEINRSFYQSLLFRHDREKLWEWENRRKRAYYYNFPAQIVNMLVSYAVKKPPTREGDEIRKQFWEAPDEDRQTTMDQQMRDALRWAQVYGLYWAVVDVDTDDDKDPDSDGKPYLYWVAPLDVLDWSMGEDGDIEWLKQFVYVEAKREWDSKVTPAYRYRVWGRKEVVTYETASPLSGIMTGNTGPQVSIVERRPNLLGKVPWVPLYARRDCDALFPDGTSFMGDMAFVANHVYNLCSLLSDILYKQTFSQLIVPGTFDAVEMGTNTFLSYQPNGSGGEPKFISPDVGQATALLDAIAAAIEQVRQIVGVGRGRAGGSMQKSSADALELESEDKKTILGDIAAEATDFEQRLIALVDEYRTGGKPAEQPYIAYAQDFDLRAFAADIEEALALQKFPGVPELMTKRLLKELAQRKFAGLPPADMDELLAAIEAEVLPDPLASKGLDPTGKPLPPPPMPPGATPGKPGFPPKPGQPPTPKPGT